MIADFLSKSCQSQGWAGICYGLLACYLWFLWLITWPNASFERHLKLQPYDAFSSAAASFRGPFDVSYDSPWSQFWGAIDPSIASTIVASEGLTSCHSELLASLWSFLLSYSFRLFWDAAWASSHRLRYWPCSSGSPAACCASSQASTTGWSSDSASRYSACLAWAAGWSRFSWLGGPWFLSIKIRSSFSALMHGPCLASDSAASMKVAENWRCFHADGSSETGSSTGKNGTGTCPFGQIWFVTFPSCLKTTFCLKWRRFIASEKAPSALA